MDFVLGLRSKISSPFRFLSFLPAITAGLDEDAYAYVRTASIDGVPATDFF